MTNIRVSWRAVTAAIAALDLLGEIRSDPRALGAAEEFRNAMREEAVREIEFANSPPPLPAFLRRQAD